MTVDCWDAKSVIKRAGWPEFALQAPSLVGFWREFLDRARWMTAGVVVRWTALNTLAGCIAAGTKAARTPPCCAPEITTLGYRGSLRTVCRDLQPLRTHQHRAALTPSTLKVGEVTSWLLRRTEDLDPASSSCEPSCAAAAHNWTVSPVT
jgi:hypothetical protein